MPEMVFYAKKNGPNTFVLESEQKTFMFGMLCWITMLT
jgi:hypothetical protein